MSVVPFPGEEPDSTLATPPRGTVALSALLIIVNGAVRLGQTGGAVVIFLLAAVGLISLLGGR